MSRTRQLVKAITKLFKQIGKQSLSAIKRQIIWLLRTIFGTRRRRGSANAGFVLPTVAMVSLVVVLLTTAILFRSFERSKSASNVRVNEAVLKAAAPALDRAKSKLDKLFEDPRLPRSTPSDDALYNLINGNLAEFTFGDETQLKLVNDVNNDGSVVEDDGETLRTAWKYPVDTDNNGKFDSFAIYGIYFRTPTGTATTTTNADGTTTSNVASRPRSVLESRAQPMDEGATGGKCASNVATSADLVGSQGWYKVGSKLKRSIFVYTTYVPITDLAGVDNTGNQYEEFTGNKGFASLEYQQDRERFPLTNNAVIYENDLEITPGAGININGRVFTNGNLLTRNTVRFYLVSSPFSCYHTQDNSKIVVAGNVIDSRVNESEEKISDVKVDLFKDIKPYPGDSPAQEEINNAVKTVPQNTYGNTAAYNDAAYTQRINRLVTEANGIALTSLPKEVQDGITSATTADANLSAADAKLDQLKIYFKKRTRRVPYAEVNFGQTALDDDVTNYPTPLISNEGAEALRPIDAWVFPFDPIDGTTEIGYAEIGIRAGSGNKIRLAATDPATLRGQTVAQELEIGDRILVGNNLPQFWYDNDRFVSSEKGQDIVGREWDDTSETRKRFTQASQLDDFGATDRNGFWEKAASQKPTNPLDVVGGLRVVTGAGIYLPDNRTPASTSADFTADLGITDKVWPDSMSMGVTTPLQGLPNAQTPYLKMRATAVYHYQDDHYDPKTPTKYQTPIACVASYYNPTNSTTAKNRTQDFAVAPNDLTGLTGLNSASPNGLNAVDPDSPANTNNQSLNGIVYSVANLQKNNYTPPLDYQTALDYQAALKYPSGRLVNQPLKEALDNIAASKNLTLSEQSAVDSAMCALRILDGSIGVPDNTAIPHGAIRETTLLDARQVKAIDRVVGSTNYDLDIELRQPLEIRATVLDLNLLRGKSKVNGEFLFPNSGIIYATRDDALPDLSAAANPNNPTNDEIDASPTDFELDPTRRPNGIMLINGGDLSRNATYKAEEKGLILASNLPVYVKGDFNVHTEEEFLEDLDVAAATLWNNFYSRGSNPASDLNPNFACRQDQFPSCDTGETWRPATILADAITVLSDNFRLGYRNDGDYNLRNNYDTVDNLGNPVFLTNFDANGDGSLGNVSESDFGFDLNGNGNVTDTNVAEATGITASAAAKINGFWDNNFVTSRSFQDDQFSAATSLPEGSSYFNNFVTPIQRRVEFSEYVMEICRKSTVTACKPDDWVVGYDLDGLNGFDATEKNIKANQLVKALADAGITSLDTARLWAGTTNTSAAAGDATDPAPDLYPRRVAFLRYGNGLTVAVNSGGGTVNTSTTNHLVIESDTSSPVNNAPIPLGIFNNSGSLEVRYFPVYNTLTINNTGSPAVNYPIYNTSNQPRTQPNTLWFRTDNAGAESYNPDNRLAILNASSLTGSRPTEQPLLVPVLQIHYPIATSGTTVPSPDSNGNDVRSRTITNWFQNAADTQTNIVFAQGDTPSRPNEFAGGLENFIRYLERWETSVGVYRNHQASGSFIEFKRSSYATAPWQVLITNPTGTTFGYPQQYKTTLTSGATPFYTPANRLWGYDVALLTQLPDLFSQRFTSPSVNAPNEFFREVGRDDKWVQTLLCAAQNTTVGYVGADETKYGSGYDKYAISSDQRPSSICP